MNAADKAQGLPSVRSKQENKHLIPAEVVFGDPKELHCGGIGICRLLPTNLHRSAHIPSVPVVLFFPQSGGMELHLQRSDLQDTVRRKQFTDGFFHVHTALRLPRWIQKKIPANAQVTILPGAYSYRETASCLAVMLY